MGLVRGFQLALPSVKNSYICMYVGSLLVFPLPCESRRFLREKEVYFMKGNRCYIYLCMRLGLRVC